MSYLWCSARWKDTTRGEVDGVFGLRTRASIRGVTGQLDAQTAVKLGVRPEGREEVGY
jgi:hypothetical protein